MSELKIADQNLVVDGNLIVSDKKNLQTRRGKLGFSHLDGDINHTIYNNGSNVDGEGAWDGMKMNVYKGLEIRTGDVPTGKTVCKLKITETGVEIKGLKLSDDAEEASQEKAGALRYRELPGGGGSVIEACMKGKNGAYAWDTVHMHQ